MEMMGTSSENDLIGKPSGILNFNHENAINSCELSAKTLTFQSLDLDLNINGEIRHFVYTIYPLMNHNNEPLALVAQYHDVTVERQAQKTLENFNSNLQTQLEIERKKLEESNQQLLQTSKMAAVGELAGGVAHEINNPNGVILAGAMYVKDKLKKDPSSPEFIFKYLERIIKQSERIDEIVSALLTFSRRKPQQKADLSLIDAINDALELAGPRLHRFKINYQGNLPPDLPSIEGNQNELVHVFVNLFNNAADEMGEKGGEITLTAEKYDDTVLGKSIRIYIHNTGDQIPDDILKKMMEPFFTTKPVGKGTGLGLSISHGIVEDHGGKMTVKNHPSGGAEFRIILPLKKINQGEVTEVQKS
jgi:two-component system NtrC family sensor kinase